ncbi:ABC transporter permease subunit/CPBP intramembrane protease [Crateriforma conspicua]|uniref:ABC transporter permease subunit/CPBP intramembrane protease n=1 Tax=Crateriforma conspicua TaxID=2527996 RepID=UPI00118D45AB|nr:ABC transporter permease subunit/CPBP intramembrane protease [Crateriforma conspicua]QDV63147.1 ABC-2 family transporter protein [Crateriforma conspicua]
MNASRLFRLCRKELRETLRDRRTIITLVFMPLLVYPLLSMALHRFLLNNSEATETAYKIGVATVDEADLLDIWINSPDAMPPDEILKANGDRVAEFEILLTDISPLTALESRAVDVAAEVTMGGPDQQPSVKVTSYNGDAVGRSARRILVERIQWFKLRMAERFADRFAAGPRYRQPVDVEIGMMGEDKSTSMLGTVVPLVLVLMTITGAVYPAIDLTAGERERGTMEALMASPVPRSAVLMAKYIAVVTVALLTAIANLTAMFTTLWAGGLLPLLTGDDHSIGPVTVLQILALLVLFSCFFSALLLSLTSFARSFKEAQAYLIPIMLLSLAPAMVSLLPGIELSGPLAIAPLLNIVLLTRDVLAGDMTPVAAGATIASTLAYAAAAIAVAAKLFGSDAVSRTSGQSIGSIFLRPAKSRETPTLQVAATVLALLVPIYFVVSNGLIRFLDSAGDSFQMSSRLVLNAVALAVTFGGVPLLVAWFNRLKLVPSFRLRTFPWTAALGAIILGLGAWVFAHEAFVLADAVGIKGLTESKIAQTEKVLEAWKQVSPVLLLATLAMTPAVIEELCFRGFLFSAFAKFMSPAKTIIVTAVLFGAFHVLTGNALLLERFVPSTLLGLILGWIAYRTGSVIPGMLMHFVHNGLLELAARYEDKLTFLGEGFEDQSHLPASWLITGAALSAIGVALLWWATRSKTIPSAESAFQTAPTATSDPPPVESGSSDLDQSTNGED